MENHNNVQKEFRTREEKERIIQQWQQSGRSRKHFCEENQINYNSLVAWCKQFKGEGTGQGFSMVKVKQQSDVYAQVHLPTGVRIDFFEAIPAEHFRILVR